jgi:hypothetical protein
MKFNRIQSCGEKMMKDMNESKRAKRLTEVVVSTDVAAVVSRVVVVSVVVVEVWKEFIIEDEYDKK